MMKKCIRITVLSLAIIFIVLTACLSFLVSTQTGLRTTIQLINWAIPGQLTVQQAKGRLIRQWSLQGLTYHSADIDVSLDTFNLRWQLTDLLHKRLTIQQVKGGHLAIQTHTVAANPEEPDHPSQQTHDQSSLQLPISITINQLSFKQITVDDVKLSNIALQANLNEQRWQLNQLSVDAFNSRFHLQGQLKPHDALFANLEFRSQAQNEAGITAEIAIRGDWYDYAWKGYVSKPMALLTSGHVKQVEQIISDTRWQSFTLPSKTDTPIRFGSGQLNIEGNAVKMTFSLNTSLIKPYQIKLTASGYHSPDTNEASLKIYPDKGKLTALVKQAQRAGQQDNQISIEAEQLDLSQFGVPLNQINIHGQASGSTWMAAQARIQASGRYLSNPFMMSLQKDKQRISGEVSLANNRINITGRLPFPIRISGRIPSPQVFSPQLSGLKTNLDLDGQLQSQSRGQVRLTIAPGSYHNPTASDLPELQFDGGQAMVKLTPKGLGIVGKMAIDARKKLTANLFLPGFQLDRPDMEKQVISGTIGFHLNTLDFLNQLTPVLSDAQGKIDSTFSLSGPVANPNIRGNIQLSGGRFKLADNDSAFEPVSMTLSTTNHRWQLNGSINHQQSQLSLSGQGSLNQGLSGTIAIKGKQFLALNNQEYQVYLSPSLTIQLQPGGTRIEGDILVPKATISPQTFTSSQTVSDDVVFSHEKESSQPPSKLSLRIAVKMGNEVKLLVQGLSAKIAGAITIQKQDNGPITSSGQLSLVDGKYAAYGQKLDISQGELFFTGGSITNPGINVRATRTFNTRGDAFSGSNRLFDFGASNIQTMSFSNQTTVGIQVTGRVNNPKITLFSEPGNMQQSDILSMLLLGRPAGQASDSGGQLLLSAITSMGLDKGGEGGQLLSQLQNKLGLEFDMSSSSTYDRQEDEVSSSRSLGVKKKFSDRLSVGYKMGVFDSNAMVLTLTYLLNKFLSIEVNASDSGSGIDFTYNRSKD